MNREWQTARIRSSHECLKHLKTPSRLTVAPHTWSPIPEHALVSVHDALCMLVDIDSPPALHTPLIHRPSHRLDQDHLTISSHVYLLVMHGSLSRRRPVSWRESTSSRSLHYAPSSGVLRLNIRAIPSSHKQSRMSWQISLFCKNI